MSSRILGFLSYSTFLGLVGCSAGANKEIAASVFRGGTVTGQTVAALSSADFVYPRFSPTGDRLAFSEVLVEDDYENTQILILDVRTGAIDTVLPASVARRYGVYASFVADLWWSSSTELAAQIHDGDVESTILTLDVSGGRLLGGEHVEPGVEPLSEELQAVLTRLHELYPDMRRPDDDFFGGPLGSALYGPAIVLNDTAVILQLNYAGYDHDIWYYSLRDSLRFRLLDLPERSIHALGGGVVVGDGVAFVVRIDQQANVFLFTGSLPPTLVARAAATQQTPMVLARYTSGRGAWFLVRAHPTYREGHNPAFFFDGSEVRPLEDYESLYDFDVHPGARRIAFCYWVDDRRNIVVKELLLR